MKESKAALENLMLGMIFGRGEDKNLALSLLKRVRSI